MPFAPFVAIVYEVMGGIGRGIGEIWWRVKARCCASPRSVCGEEGKSKIGDVLMEFGVLRWVLPSRSDSRYEDIDE